MKEYEVEIIQTAPMGPDHAVSITLTERESRIRFLEIRMSLEQFGKMLHAPQIASATVITRNLERLGWKAENKTEIVPFSGGRDAEEKRAALEPFEVDGWRGHLADLSNRHRHTKDGYRVTFFRHVPPEAP